MLNLHCFQFYESNAELCLIFDNEKLRYTFFGFVRQTSTQFPEKQEWCQHPQVA